MFPKRDINCPQCKGFMGYLTTNHKDFECKNKKCNSQFQMVNSVLGVKDGKQYFAYNAKGIIWTDTNLNNVDKKPTDDKLEQE